MRQNQKETASLFYFIAIASLQQKIFGIRGPEGMEAQKLEILDTMKRGGFAN